MCSARIAVSAKPARRTVSPQTIAMARGPTSASLRNEVFIPRAVMAVTRHQRESSSSVAVTACGIRSVLPTSTSAAEPRTKKGIGSLPSRLAPG